MTFLAYLYVTSHHWVEDGWTDMDAKRLPQFFPTHVAVAYECLVYLHPIPIPLHLAVLPSLMVQP